MEEEEAADMVNKATKYAIRHDDLSIRQTPGVGGCSEEAERGENARRGLRDAGVVNTAIPPARNASI